MGDTEIDHSADFQSFLQNYQSSSTPSYNEENIDHGADFAKFASSYNTQQHDVNHSEDFQKFVSLYESSSTTTESYGNVNHAGDFQEFVKQYKSYENVDHSGDFQEFLRNFNSQRKEDNGELTVLLGVVITLLIFFIIGSIGNILSISALQSLKLKFSKRMLLIFMHLMNLVLLSSIFMATLLQRMAKESRQNEKEVFKFQEIYSSIWTWSFFVSNYLTLILAFETFINIWFQPCKTLQKLFGKFNTIVMILSTVTIGAGVTFLTFNWETSTSKALIQEIIVVGLPSFGVLILMTLILLGMRRKKQEESKDQKEQDAAEESFNRVVLSIFTVFCLMNIIYLILTYAFESDEEPSIAMMIMNHLAIVSISLRATLNPPLEFILSCELRKQFKGLKTKCLSPWSLFQIVLSVCVAIICISTIVVGILLVSET